MKNGKPVRRRNNYFSKPRRSVNMWVIYYKLPKEQYYFPRLDAQGSITAYPSKSAAAADLYETRQYHGQAYLQRVGPISQ